MDLQVVKTQKQTKTRQAQSSGLQSSDSKSQKSLQITKKPSRLKLPQIDQWTFTGDVEGPPYFL